MGLNSRGQNTLEYAMIIAVVVAALLAINTYVNKGVQGRIKESADQIGRQFEPDSFTTAWETKSSGDSVTKEERDAETGSTKSTIETAETITRSEGESWGVVPNQHYNP